MKQTCEYCGSDNPVEATVEIEGEDMDVCHVCRYMVCRVCGEMPKVIVKHHVSYLYDITIPVCQKCHMRIHNQTPDLEELQPAISRGRAESMGLSLKP